MEIQELIQKLRLRSNLSAHEIEFAFDRMLQGLVEEEEIISFLQALSIKGETSEEIQAAVDSIKLHSVSLSPRTSRPIIDTCGTGGDSIRTFNISTASAIVASAAGACVAKHGNRSSSGICGSADFMEAIGLDLYVSPPIVKESIEKFGLAFLFAPAFHPLMRNVSRARKKIGVRTIFNIAGPLSNPCKNITGQVIGVFSRELMPRIAKACEDRIPNFMIVNSSEGLDEFSTAGDNDVLWVQNAQRRAFQLNGRELGLSSSKPKDLIVHSKEDSIAKTLSVIYGRSEKIHEDIVILNSAAALLISNLCRTFEEGVSMSRDAIQSGESQRQLTNLVMLCGDASKLKIAEEIYLSH